MVEVTSDANGEGREVIVKEGLFIQKSALKWQPPSYDSKVRELIEMLGSSINSNLSSLF